ncbi:methyltransferase [Vibrio vulnificus]|uniref:methyltransferase n=1 Tax=Vibrio vulnificus TaxID=672 RepID=UPI00188D7FF4|nr:methyltransferase [Vibrio vulnificus]MBF4449770.1 methyltransferase [Vibrio vulnificus]MBF4495300.1 methyltransferase [Vibrio vulnificus]MBL6179754.1 methyltransferase [Vibrio vulnificus]HDY7980125.1 methyltransferase [Vibrio vulnificus]HDY8003586.1 methyltransferase [Vibrio vulnificus]
MKTELNLFDRQLTLFRYPNNANETLQAWDAGDEYLINYVEELALDTPQNILILNDHFGALSCWFSAHHQVTMMSDSFISQQGAKENLQRNQCRKVKLLTTLDAIPVETNLVVFQLPKNNRHLTWQLTQLRKTLSPDVPVVAVNKAKEIHTSTLKLFEKYLGTTKTSLAWKKHRLVFCQADCAQMNGISPVTRWNVEEHKMTLNNLPNVYSGESLDLGARFMLEHIPQDENLKHIIDLGCGNGVLSVKAAQLNPKAKLTLVDESYMAIESARLNLQENVTVSVDAEYIANNCLDGFAGESADLILCNPPFHQQQAITDHIAWQMFCDAKRVLKRGGKLQVIGNRHLGYDGKLKRLYGDKNVKLVASNSKFVILQATK